MNPVLGYANNQLYLRSKASVSVEFLVEDVYWGTYGNPMSPEPGDRNVPLTVVIQQNSPYYLRGIIGYLYLPPGFIDSHSETNVSKASGIAIETDNDAHDIIPYGSFYLTFYLNLNNSLTKGTYNMTLNITYYVINNTIFLEGEPQIIRISVIIPNRAPEIYTVEPSNARVAVYAGDNKTFYIEAKDPDNDSLTYTWYLDGEKVGEGQNYTYFATEEDFGTHTLRVEVSDGDLTTSNIILTPNHDVVFIDFGLGEINNEDEAKGIELRVLWTSLSSVHYKNADVFLQAFLQGYTRNYSAAKRAIKIFHEIRLRGRYIAERRLRSMYIRE